MKKFLRTVAIAAIFAAASAGAAQAEEGWYGRGDIGMGFHSSVELGGAEFDLDEGPTAILGVGYGLANGIRLEAEAGYRTNEFEAVDEDVTALSLMANAIYDFNRDGLYRPYVGVGAGWAQVDPNLAEEEAGFAYQALLGVGIPFNERVTVDFGLRYLVAENLEFGGVESDYRHQTASIGLRWAFAAPPAPAPVPAPAPTPTPAPTPAPQPAACPTSEFVVYFEWDRSNLNQQALEVIDQAVARARQCNVSNTVVVGHTDTSGSTEYNIGLSQRRAAVVRDALVSRGMAAGSITTDARGETDLARPTRDGVREPLNRRTAVTITFR